MIMKGVDEADGGTEGLNAFASRELREAFAVVSARELLASRMAGDGSLEGVEALLAGRSVATLLGDKLGRWEEAKGLLAAGEGSDGVLVLQTNLANLLAGKLKDYMAARPLQEAAAAGNRALHGAEDERTLHSRNKLAVTLKNLGEVAAAQREYDAVRCCRGRS